MIGTNPRVRAVELTLVTLVALAILLPGIWGYTLIDPWETHYGDVARRMLADHDWVHTTWQDEGFRSKPILSFWMMATSMKALGVASDGGYSGELVSSGWVMFALRLPFVLAGVLGLVSAWWMLARLITRRVAWLALFVLGTMPFYALVARQAIPDMPLTATLVAAMAMFAVACESGDESLEPLGRVGPKRAPITIDHRHVFALVAGGFILLQAIGFAANLAQRGRLAIPIDGRVAGLLIGGPMLLGVVALVLTEVRGPGLRWLRTTAYCVLGIPTLWFFALIGIRAIFTTKAEALHDVRPTTTTRQVFLYWFWFFLGVSVLAKGPPALAIAGISCAFYVILLGRWREFFEDRFELVRGFAILCLVAIPWHIAMYFADGRNFPHEYLYTHLLGRAAVGDGADKGAKGTFAAYAVQIGYGMFVWAALLPGAIAGLAMRLKTDTPEGRTRLLVAIWAMVAMAFFSMVAAKFHHYILPAIPAFAIAIAFWLDDVLAGRARGVGVLALIGAGIVLLIANDMMSEQKCWIELFVYRYDRPWPSAAPWQVDVSDAFLGFGVAAAIALAVMALPRLARVGVVLFGGVALATTLWALHVYMPLAAQHWGMRTAIVRYYDQREIRGAHLVYDGPRQLAEAWGAHDADGVRDTWTIRTYIPERIQEGQPVTIRITMKTPDDKKIEQELRLSGTISRVDVDGARLIVAVPAAEQAKLAPLIKAGRAPKARSGVRAPIQIVDADRLIAWQLYWRGENWWSGDEIWGPLPEVQTAFKQTDNVAFLKYLNDRTLAPEGVRYWIVTEAGRTGSLKTILPTQRAKETFQIEDTSSNKFSLVSFIL